MRAPLLTALLLIAACADAQAPAPAATSRPATAPVAAAPMPQPRPTGTAAQQESAILNRALGNDARNDQLNAADPYSRRPLGPARDPYDVGAMGTLPVEQAPGFRGL